LPNCEKKCLNSFQATSTKYCERVPAPSAQNRSSLVISCYFNFSLPRKRVVICTFRAWGASVFLPKFVRKTLNAFPCFQNRHTNATSMECMDRTSGADDLALDGVELGERPPQEPVAPCGRGIVAGGGRALVQRVPCLHLRSSK